MYTIHPLFLGFPGKLNRGFLGWSSCFLIEIKQDSTRKLILYDTAGYNERKKLLQLLSEKSINISDINAVVISHLHFDHAANWPLFENSDIYIHEKELYPPDDYIDYARLDFHSDKLISNQRTKLVSEGDEIEGIKIIELPGHTPGLIGLEIENQLLVSDAIKNRIELRDGPLLNIWNEVATTSSISKITQKADIIYPGHDVPLQKKNGDWLPMKYYEENLSLTSGLVSKEGKNKITLSFNNEINKK